MSVGELPEQREESSSEKAVFPDRFISRPEVREKLGLSEEGLRREENKDGWPEPHLIGARKKYRGDELNEWVESRRVGRRS